MFAYLLLARNQHKNHSRFIHSECDSKEFKIVPIITHPTNEKLILCKTYVEHRCVQEPNKIINLRSSFDIYYVAVFAQQL